MPHMTTSPFKVNGLADGRADGVRDAARMAQKPPLKPLGMDPEKAWSWRYKQGYQEVLSLANGQVSPANGRSEPPEMV